MASHADRQAPGSAVTLSADWIAQFSEVSPPLLSTTAEAIAEKKDSPAASIPWLVDLCGQAPGLGIALMLESNRPLVKSQRPACLSANQMCLLLGLPRALDVASQLPTINDLSPDVRVAMARCYSSVFLAADICSSWRSHRADIREEELHGLLLIHAMTEMLLWMKAPEQLADLETQPELFEYRLPIGASLDEIGLALIDALPLPGEFRDSLQADSDGRSAAGTAARLAYIISRMVHRWGWQQSCLHPYFEQAASFLGIDEEALILNLHHTAVDSARRQPQFDPAIKPAAFQILLLPPPRPRKAASAVEVADSDEVVSKESVAPVARPDAEPRAQQPAQKTQTKTPPTTRPAKVAPAASAQKPARPASKEQSPAPLRTHKPAAAKAAKPAPASSEPPQANQAALALRECVRDLRQAPAAGATPQAVIDTCLKGIHAGLQLNTVFLLLLGKDKQALTLRCLYDGHSTGIAEGDRFSLSESRLFQSLLAQPGSFHLKDNNRGRYRQHLPPVLAALCEQQELVIRPLIVRKKPIALVLALHPKVNQQRYQQFNQLCELAARGLSGPDKG